MCCHHARAHSACYLWYLCEVKVLYQWSASIYYVQSSIVAIAMIRVVQSLTVKDVDDKGEEEEEEDSK